MTGSDKTLLLVDDEPDIAASLAMYLETCIPDIECKTAISGDDGLDMTRSQRFAMIVSDFRMPGISGLEFLEAVREDDPEVPCILFTAYPDRDIARSALHKVRVDLFLQKPIEPDAMVAAVQRALRLEVDVEGGALLDKAVRDIQRLVA